MTSGFGQGKPCLWHREDPFVLPSSSAQARKDLSLRPILVERTFEDWRDLIRRKMGSGDGDLHIYANQTSLSWRNLVRRNEPGPRILHVQINFRNRTRHRRQHQSGQGITWYTTNFRATFSTTTHSSKYSITADWKMTNFGIINLDGASSPMFVENGANSSTNHHPT